MLMGWGCVAPARNAPVTTRRKRMLQRDSRSSGFEVPSWAAPVPEDRSKPMPSPMTSMVPSMAAGGGAPQYRAVRPGTSSIRSSLATIHLNADGARRVASPTTAAAAPLSVALAAPEVCSHGILKSGSADVAVILIEGSISSMKYLVKLGSAAGGCRPTPFEGHIARLPRARRTVRCPGTRRLRADCSWTGTN